MIFNASSLVSSLLGWITSLSQQLHLLQEFLQFLVNSIPLSICEFLQKCTDYFLALCVWYGTTLKAVTKTACLLVFCQRNLTFSKEQSLCWWDLWKCTKMGGMWAGNCPSSPCWLICTKPITSFLLSFRFMSYWAQGENCDFPKCRVHP